MNDQHVSQSKVSPNILHFFVDQMRFDAIRALGNPGIRTPALDRLVSEGCTFDNAYSSCPVCIPARCGMIYGQYPHHTDCYENNFPMPSDDRQSFMGMLTDAGYRTHGIGKCHFTPDPLALRGFQTRETQEELPRHPDDDDYLTYLKGNGLGYVIDPHGVRGEMYYIPQVSQIPPEHHPTKWVGDRAIAFLEEEGNNDDPWYLFTSFIHPHPPFSPPTPWHKMYGIDDVPSPNIPLQYDQLLQYVNRAQNRYKYRDQGFDYNLIRMIRAYYYSCISFIDHQVGRVLEVLDKTGATENTLIIFTADHGEYLGDYHCFGKRGMHDAAARIPMIIAQPGVFDGGKRLDSPVSLVDLAPTIAASIGNDDKDSSTHSWDGIPLQSVVDGTVERDVVFSQLAFVKHSDGTSGDEFLSLDPVSSEERAENSTYMVVSKDYKYIYSAQDDKELFFDRSLDPKETRNRIHSARYQAVVTAMREQLMKHLVAGGESEGISNGDWVHYSPKQLPKDPDYGLLHQDQAWSL
jgi:arylsulfatase A-like enzyme